MDAATAIVSVRLDERLTRCCNDTLCSLDPALWGGHRSLCRHAPVAAQEKQR